MNLSTKSRLGLAELKEESTLPREQGLCSGPASCKAFPVGATACFVTVGDSKHPAAPLPMRRSGPPCSW